MTVHSPPRRRPLRLLRNCDKGAGYLPRADRCLTVVSDARRDGGCNVCVVPDEQAGMRTDRDTRWGDLLRAANRGDRIAYGQFLAEVAPVLRGLIEARSGRRAGECEDIVQETLIAIHEKRHTWREDAPVARWLYAIARYKTVDAWRRQARESTVPLRDEGEHVADPAGNDPTLARDLDHLLGRIDERSARIVRDMKLKGFSAEETGARNGMNAGAVRVALHRAMARLTAITRTANEKDR